MMPSSPTDPPRGRGAASRAVGRYETWQREPIAADEPHELDPPRDPRTVIQVDRARSLITRNDSPDVPFSQSINHYRGCEHGCAYCFARPTHAWLGLSPGLDFETRLFHKPDAPELLRRELARPGYVCSTIALGINTDAYQPIERQLGLTRQLLQVLLETRHPVSIVTKGALIERDTDLLAQLAERRLVQVMFSITTLDRELARRLEPRASAPQRRLAAMRTLAAAGVSVGVLFAPLIPALNDHEMEAVLEAAAEAGARSAAYVVLRLPHELRELFPQWLSHAYPGRAEHVMSLVRQLRGGNDYDARFGRRMRGEGPLAALYAQRLALACRRLGLNQERGGLNCSDFRPPSAPSAQLQLF